MKAKEYYNKYSPKFVAKAKSTDGILDTIKEMLLEFNEEAVNLCDKRHIRRDNAVRAVIKEQNQKWNAVCELFVKGFGASPTLKDGFQIFWEKKMPELKLERR
jgi:hypothetical protein